MKQFITPLVMPVIRFATRSYIAGDKAIDARILAEAAREHGFACTLCYWNDGKEEPDTVAAQYRSAIDEIHFAGLDGCIAIKTPALWDRAALAADVARYARERGVRVMFDSHAPGQSDDIFRAIDLCGPEGVGLAIPGRWRRSEADAERAISLGLHIRIVKGQWPDEPDKGADIRAGYLALTERVAGRARHVGVATHDAALSRTALERLIGAGTPCEQELIYPDPVSEAVKVADALGTPSRLYIPFGSAWLGYSLSKAFRRPQVLVWLMRDIVVANRFKMPVRTPTVAGTKH